MLVLSRKETERLFFDVGDVTITVHVIEIDRDKVRLGIEAPKEVKIMRAELVEKERYLGGES